MATHSSTLPGKFHGQRSLVGYSQWGCKESDTTERLPSLCMKCSLGISSFLEEISSLSHSVVFLYFFALITSSNGYTFLFSFVFRFTSFSQLFVRPPQTTMLPFYMAFSWGCSWCLPPVQSHEPPSIVLQALCLSDLIPLNLQHLKRSGAVLQSEKVLELGSGDGWTIVRVNLTPLNFWYT